MVRLGRDQLGISVGNRPVQISFNDQIILLSIIHMVVGSHLSGGCGS